MRTSQFTNEQIAMALRQAETGTPLEEICRKLGINESTFYRWKRRFGGPLLGEVEEALQAQAKGRDGLSRVTGRPAERPATW